MFGARKYNSMTPHPLVLEKGGGQTTVEKNADPWSGQQGYLTDIFTNAQKQFYGQSPQYFQGNAVAPLSPETIEGQQYLTDYAKGGATQNVNEMNKALQYNLTGALDVTNNPYLDKAIAAATNPAIEQFSDTGGVLANIRSDIGSAGQYGSSRQGIATGIAADRLQQNLLDTGAKMASAAYGQGLDASGKALAMAPGVMQAGMMPATMLDAVGQQNRAYEQSLIDEAMNKWNFEQNVDAAKLANYQGLVQGNFGGTSTAIQTGGGPNKAVSAIGGAATGAALGTMGTAIATGASMGSVVPGWGTAIGAGIGALIGLLG